VDVPTKVYINSLSEHSKWFTYRPSSRISSFLYYSRCHSWRRPKGRNVLDCL